MIAGVVPEKSFDEVKQNPSSILALSKLNESIVSLKAQISEMKHSLNFVLSSYEETSQTTDKDKISDMKLDVQLNLLAEEVISCTIEINKIIKNLTI